MRLELVTPHGDSARRRPYNRLFTLHGIVMVWFFLVPSIPTTLGNFLLPLMIGAREVAFPRLNLFTWYCSSPAQFCTLYALIAGGVDTGWTFYTPFSTMFSNSHVIAAAVGVFVAGFSIDRHRGQFHRHDAHAARAWHDLVPPAAVRLGASMRPASSWCWRRRCWP